MSDLQSAGLLSSSSSSSSSASASDRASLSLPPNARLLDSVKAALSDAESPMEQEKKIGEMIHQLETLKRQMAATTTTTPEDAGSDGNGAVDKKVSFFPFSTSTLLVTFGPSILDFNGLIFVSVFTHVPKFCRSNILVKITCPNSVL